MIPYFGGEIAIGKLIDVSVNSLVVGWALFFMFKTIKRWRISPIATNLKRVQRAESVVPVIRVHEPR